MTKDFGMKRLMGLAAVALGIALLAWVGVAVAIDHPLVHDRTPLKPVLFSFVLLSAGVSWISEGDETEAET